MVGDFNDNVENHAEDYEDQFGDHGYGVRKMEGKRIKEFCVAMEWQLGIHSSSKRQVT